METYDDSGLRYDVAEICENGHVVSTAVRRNPAQHQPYCADCGALTITTCPRCEAPIRGESNAMYDSWKYPRYCCHCGAIFPWTERRLQALAALRTWSWSTLPAGPRQTLLLQGSLAGAPYIELSIDLSDQVADLRVLRSIAASLRQVGP